MNIKAILNYAVLILVSIGLAACNDSNDIGEVLTFDDIAVTFSGNTTGNINAEDGTVTGTVSVSNGSSIQAQTNVAQTYGSFSINSAGQWTYTLDNANAAVQALNAGETVTETISITSADGNTSSITVTVTGVNDVAVLGGVNTGSIASNITTPLTGSLSITDADSTPDTLVVQTDTASTYGSFSITEAGAWTYTLDTTNSAVQALAFGSSLMDVIAVNTTDGLTSNVTITINGAAANTPATFTGDTTGSIDAGDTAMLTGTVNVTDPDAGEDSIIAQTSAVQTYGSFSIAADGAWSYLLDNSNTDVQALTSGNTLTDTIDISSADMTAGTVTITINGVVASGTNKFARIADRATNDAGELRYTPPAAIVRGRMTAQILREAGAKAESPSEDAQIAIYGTSTSSSPAMAYITLDISGDDYDLRDSSGSSGGGSEAGFAEDKVIDFEIAWDASAASATVAPLVTVTIDGQVAFGGQFSSNSTDLTTVQNGVEVIQFRIGGTSDITAFGLTVDDFAVYSSDSGSELEVFSDDFESYTAGNSLDPDVDTNSTAPIAGAVPESATPYNNNSFDVFVVEETTTPATGGLGTSGNQFARVADRATNDAGELRYNPASAIVRGRITAQILREAGAKAESPNEDAQIAIYGSSTSSSPAMAYITLDISGDDYDLRDSSGSSGGGSEAGFAEDKVIDFEIAWDASAASATVAPLVTVTIDGQVAFGGQFSSNSTDLTTVQNGVEVIQFRIGGTSDITAFGLAVDNFVVYSSDSGSELEVFNDDFESYTAGNSLDPDVDTNSTAPIAGAVPESATPYNNNSFDAFVASE